MHNFLSCLSLLALSPRWTVVEGHDLQEEEYNVPALPLIIEMLVITLLIETHIVFN